MFLKMHADVWKKNWIIQKHCRILELDRCQNGAPLHFLYQVFLKMDVRNHFKNFKTLSRMDAASFKRSYGSIAQQ